MIDQQRLVDAYDRHLRETRRNAKTVSKLTGISNSTLSRFRRNVGRFDIDVLLKIASYLKMPLVSGVARGKGIDGVMEAITDDRYLTDYAKGALKELMWAAYHSFQINRIS